MLVNYFKCNFCVNLISNSKLVIKLALLLLSCGLLLKCSCAGGYVRILYLLEFATEPMDSCSLLLTSFK